MLIQTQNLGKTTVAELSSSMGKVIPTANAYHVQFDQLCTGYAKMTANGVATAESTTYMNSMLNELGKSGTTVSDILKEKTGKSFAELMENTGVYSIVTPKNITANIIIGYARAMKSAKDTEMRSLYRIVNNKAEAMEFRVTRESELTSKSLSQIKMKHNALIAAILRNNKIMLPDGESKLEVGDTVVIMTTHHIATLGDILA